MRILHRLEDLTLVLLLSTMIVTAVLQIVLRNTTGSALVWGDTLVRILVLWVGLVGAMVATRQNKHINIDVVTRHLSPDAARAVNGITFLSAFLICLVTAWYSLLFVRMEFDFTTPAFANVPTWACQTIIPAAFLVMALRCLGLAVRSFTSPPESVS
ncbi:MAG: TRAP transporter small permease [Desulfobacterium sp.]|nr:TRAP transporter small permease [Desulfobacterium sp.]